MKKRKEYLPQIAQICTNEKRREKNISHKLHPPRRTFGNTNEKRREKDISHKFHKFTQMKREELI